MFKLIEDEIGGFVLFGEFKSSDEGEDLVEGFEFDIVASDFALLFNLFLRRSIHLSFFLSLRLSLGSELK